MPFILLLLWASGALILLQTGSMAGQRYSSIDAMLETAQIIQDDLKQDYYQGNTFDIGAFEPTIPGVLSKAPQALLAGIFRPFIWESKNIVMLLSGIESIVLIILMVYVLTRKKSIGIFKIINQDSFLKSAVAFFMVFAFFVGLTTSNFGSLVRYRIPALPFFLILIFQIQSFQDRKTH